MTKQLQKITLENLEKVLEKEDSLGCVEDMKDGQLLIVPVSLDEEDRPVFYGCLDFTGKSTGLSEEDWTNFTEEITGYKPIGKTILRKSSNPDGMYIYAMSSSSIGACDSITVFNSIWDLLEGMIKWNEFGKDEKKIIKDTIKKRDIEGALLICEDIFSHSFFTGVVWGAFEYVSGYKPNKDGFAVEVK